MEINISRFKGIEEKIYELEVVTPLFLGGADPQKAEIRTAPFKAAMRFWWRAINPDLSIAQLKKNESKIFGDSGETGKSRTTIRIVDVANCKRTQRFSPVPHKNAAFAFEGFDLNQKFSISLKGSPKEHTLFELTMILGGIGKRARRGFGKLKIVKINGENYSKELSLSTVKNLIDNLVPQKFSLAQNGIFQQQQPTANYGYIKEIKIGNAENDAFALLRKIGQSSHNNKSDFTGFAHGQSRMSSPIYVSVVKNGKQFYPIITTLNSAFRQHPNMPDKSTAFKNQILGGAR